MSIVILDLDLAQWPPTVSVPERYNWASILIRLHGRPVGRTMAPVVAGRVGGDDLREQLVQAAGWPLWERWLRDHLQWDELPAGAPSPPATVAVCTRDRPEDLQRCLEALLRLPDDGQELLVIDNCPSQNATRQVVQACNDREGGGDGRPIRYVREDRPGLNRARNRALQEARHDVVAFADDDTAPDPGWLRALVRNFEDPMVLCVTGLAMPIELETDAQQAFESYNSLARGFERVAWDSTKLSPYKAGRAGTGANMALRRSVLQTIGPFDEAIGAGTPTRAGDDTEMFARILAAGYRMVYDPAALSWHHHRRTWEELRQVFYRNGVGIYAIWTRSLLQDRDWNVWREGWDWFWHVQWPALWAALKKRPGSVPRDLIAAELRGCAAGPRAYLASRRRLRDNGEER